MKLDYTAIRNRARYNQDEAELGSASFSMAQDVFDLLEVVKDLQRERDEAMRECGLHRASFQNAQAIIAMITEKSVERDMENAGLHKELRDAQRELDGAKDYTAYGLSWGTIPSAVQE